MINIEYLEYPPHTSQTQDTWKRMIPFINGWTLSQFSVKRDKTHQSHNSVKKKKKYLKQIEIANSSSVFQHLKPSQAPLGKQWQPMLLEYRKA